MTRMRSYVAKYHQTTQWQELLAKYQRNNEMDILKLIQDVLTRWYVPAQSFRQFDHVKLLVASASTQ